MYRFRIVLSVFILLLLLGCAENNDVDPAVPSLKIKPVSLPEGSAGHALQSIPVFLEAPFADDIHFTWSTLGMTASSWKDYIPVDSQPEIIKAGKDTLMLSLTLIGDTLAEFTEQFIIKLYDFNVSALDDFEFTITIEDDDILVPEAADDGYITPLQLPEMNLVWHDEFSEDTLNGNYWNRDPANAFPRNCGWGYDEKGKYSGGPENLSLKDGKLIITSTVDPQTGIYRTSRITSMEKFTLTGGRIDVRARLAEAPGTASNIWMLGHDMSDVGWPAAGEIDIMRYAGKDRHSVHGGLVYDSENGPVVERSVCTAYDSDCLSEKFNIYTLIWEENRMQWLVNDKLYRVLDANDLAGKKILNKPFFLVINLAVGGEFAENIMDPSDFPQTMTVDYIRVYQPVIHDSDI